MVWRSCASVDQFMAEMIRCYLPFGDSDVPQAKFLLLADTYFSEEKIDMTAPVLVRIIPGQGPACKDDFRMSFFIAPKVTDPPKPTNPNVTLSKLPAQTAYVK